MVSLFAIFALSFEFILILARKNQVWFRPPASAGSIQNAGLQAGSFAWFVTKLAGFKPSCLLI